MKSLILLFILVLFVGCYDDSYDTQSKDCDKHYDLCMDGGSDEYSICCDNYGCWYEVYGTKYYTSEYMIMMECE